MERNNAFLAGLGHAVGNLDRTAVLHRALDLGRAGRNRNTSVVRENHAVVHVDGEHLDGPMGPQVALKEIEQGSCRADRRFRVEEPLLLFRPDLVRPADVTPVLHKQVLDQMRAPTLAVKYRVEKRIC